MLVLLSECLLYCLCVKRGGQGIVSFAEIDDDILSQKICFQSENTRREELLPTFMNFKR